MVSFTSLPLSSRSTTSVRLERKASCWSTQVRTQWSLFMTFVIPVVFYEITNVQCVYCTCLTQVYCTSKYSCVRRVHTLYISYGVSSLFWEPNLGLSDKFVVCHSVYCIAPLIPAYDILGTMKCIEMGKLVYIVAYIYIYIYIYTECPKTYVTNFSWLFPTPN